MWPVITVTAGREQELASAADALTVLDDRRIKALNLPQVSDLLRLMPGVSVNVQGPQGSLTQIRIRGAEANHTLTFVDGIEINAPASGNETRFETLSADNESGRASGRERVGQYVSTWVVADALKKKKHNIKTTI